MMLEKELLLKFEGMESRRRNYDKVWQDIRELVRPNTSDFLSSNPPGEVRTQYAIDGTAIDACNQLASGLHSYLTNPTERWFSLGVAGMDPTDYDEDALAWLEAVADMIYCEYGREESGFNTCFHECFLDIGAFGTSCPYQEYSYKKRALVLRAFPMADIYLSEDVDGKVDTVARRVVMTKRQAKQQFATLPDKMGRDIAEEREFRIVHMVFPRTDQVAGRLDSQNKAHASVWLCQDTGELIEESGYDELPYHVGRWSKLAGEVYGTGPARNALPDIKMLNRMEMTLIRAGAKRVDPPLQVPDEGFMTPIDTSPASLIWKEDGVEHIEPLVHQGDVQWGLEQANQKREFIRQAFYSDWLRMEKENQEMTAFEVADRRNEKLQLLAPMMGRVQGEQLSPLLRRSYNLLHRAGRIPPAPVSLQRQRLMIVYISPAARAQLAIKANEMGRYVQELMPIAQIDPSILQTVDWDKFARKLAEYRGTTRTIMRPREEVEAARQQQAQATAMQQAMQVAEPATKALKNVADAQSKGLNMGGLIGA